MTTSVGTTLRIAALVKQIPKFEAMQLDAGGRLIRDGVELEMNAYCRRAVAQSVHLAALLGNATVTVITMGPASADDCLKESIAWGMQHGVDAISGVHLSDPEFAGADTLATAHVLAAALRLVGPFELVLCGRNSIDADTGQVGPQLAELLDYEFISAAKQLQVTSDGTVSARCETDDGYNDVRSSLPAVISCAERLIDPSKVEPAQRELVPATRIRTLRAADLGSGPWGASDSPTYVGTMRSIAFNRAKLRWPELDTASQVHRTVEALADRGLFTAAKSETPSDGSPRPAVAVHADTPSVAIIAEPERDRCNAELIGATGRIIDAQTAIVALTQSADQVQSLITAGADVIVRLDRDEVEGMRVESDVAAAVTQWCRINAPQFVLAPSTTWGREVAARVAASLGAGLTGDAVDLELDDDGRLVGWKPAFGGAMVAAIHCRSTPQMATVRAGVLAPGAARRDMVEIQRFAATPRSRTTIVRRERDDDIDVLADAHAVIAIGRGVRPDEYEFLQPLQRVLGAEIGATRKVTDKGWLPRATQIGITGRSITPSLCVSIGANGKFNHSVGFRNAGTVLAINSDPSAPIFECADVGIIANWRDAVPLLAEALERYGFSGR